MKHSTQQTNTRRRATPPLPPETTRLLLAGLRSRKPERKRRTIEACLAARAFEAGFSRGADPARAARRHEIDPHHEHWLRGYDAGQRAAHQAAAQYLADRLRALSAATGANSAETSVPSSDAASPPRPERAGTTRAARGQPTQQLTLF